MGAGEKQIANSKKRIAMVNLSKSWGGGEKWFLVVGKELRKRGYHVHWLCYPGSSLEQRLFEEKLPYTAISLRFLSLFNPFIFLKLRQWLKKETPQYLFLNASHEVKTAGLVGMWTGIPHIIFRRGLSYPLKDSAFNHWVMRHVITAFLGNSKATFEPMLERFPQLKEKPHRYFNNAIDTDSIRPPHIKSPSNRIGIAARLAPEKGIDRAIKSMPHVIERVPDASLHIWGEGPAQKQLQDLIGELDLEHHVFLHGFSNNILDQLSNYQVFTLPSRFGEGTSHAIVEAMGLGLPCVVFDTPAMAEMVVDGVNGFVIPDDDIKSYGDALGRLLQNPELALQYGQASRERAEKFFSIHFLLQKLEDWLMELGEKGLKEKNN